MHESSGCVGMVQDLSRSSVLQWLSFVVSESKARVGLKGWRVIVVGNLLILCADFSCLTCCPVSTGQALIYPSAICTRTRGQLVGKEKPVFMMLSTREREHAVGTG